jgi:Uma2 family endonuclease
MLPISTLSAPEDVRCSPQIPGVPPLETGDRLSREEFERRYDAMPDLKKAELIEGVVFMPSPVKARWHGGPQMEMATLMGTYMFATPGVEGYDNATIRLDLDNEPQPDLALMIEPSYGGQAKIDHDGYLSGAPEFIAEIAATSASIDLGTKFHVYRRNGVKEYLVWRVYDEKFDFFRLRQSQYEPVGSEIGIYKSDHLPGLWIDTDALVKKDRGKALSTLMAGIQSAEHHAFVELLKKKAAGQAAG